MAGTFGGCHEDINALRSNYLLVADVEAVSKRYRFAFGEVGKHFCAVHVCLLLVVDEDHDDVCSFRCLADGHNGEAVLLSDRPRLAALVESDDDITAGIAEVHCVSVSL